MRRGRRQGAAAAALDFNFTPMIDMIFTLSVFYMLVTRFHSAEQVPMLVPKPEQSEARMAKLTDRIVVNCTVPDAKEFPGRAVAYSIGPNRPEPLAEIAERLAAMKQQSPGLKVILRADRRLPYAHVRAVMQVLAHHRIEMLNVAAQVGEERRGP
jgi:biopolymer transport protein ExbD